MIEDTSPRIHASNQGRPRTARHTADRALRTIVSRRRRPVTEVSSQCSCADEPIKIDFVTPLAHSLGQLVVTGSW